MTLVLGGDTFVGLRRERIARQYRLRAQDSP